MRLPGNNDTLEETHQICAHMSFYTFSPTALSPNALILASPPVLFLFLILLGQTSKVLTLNPSFNTNPNPTSEKWLIRRNSSPRKTQTVHLHRSIVHNKTHTGIDTDTHTEPMSLFLRRCQHCENRWGNTCGILRLLTTSSLLPAYITPSKKTKTFLPVTNKGLHADTKPVWEISGSCLLSEWVEQDIQY